MWGRIITVMKKEIILIFRNKIYLGMILIAPLILFIILGYTINNDYRNIPTAVYNYQPSSYLNGFLVSLTNSKIFHLKYFVRDNKSYQNLMKEGKIRLAIGFPKNIEKLMRKKKNINLQVVIDGSNSNIAVISQGYLETLIQNFNQNQQDDHNQRVLHQKKKEFINLSTNILYNKGLASKNFIVPGLITLIILSLFPMLLGFSITEEKENGTLLQVLISKITTTEFFIGKVFLIFVLEIFIIFSLFFISIFLFNVNFNGSFLLFCLTVIIFSITSLSIGLLMASFARNRIEVGIYNSSVTVLPALLISGFMFPISNMPKPVQLFSRFIPARYSITIMRNIFLKASNLNYLLDEFIWLSILGLFLSVISICGFNKIVMSAGKGG